MDCTISTYSEIDRLQYMYNDTMYKKQSLKFIAMLINLCVAELTKLLYFR